MIEEVARAPRLLVASDFDGTLSEIVDDPDLATPLARSKAVLEELAELGGTVVAVISGRRRSELAERFDHPDFILIGEHGADHGEPPGPDTPGLARARELVDAAVLATPGAWAEHKTHSVGFHYRSAADPGPALADLRSQAAGVEGIRLIDAKRILELTSSPIDKGDALCTLKDGLAVDRVVFMGDDLSDETAFAVLGPVDLGIHVGVGPTSAGITVPTPSALADLLETLLYLRAETTNLR